MINPVHLRTLQAVIETGSFADAARLLGYTSSAVSQHVNALERTCGLVLFDREPQSVHPTTAALVLAERARTALTALDQVEQDAKLLASGREGRIRLGAFTTASTCIVPPALASFTAYRPNADVQLVEGDPADLLNGVLIGDLDVVLIYAYDVVPREWPAELAVEKIFTEELVLMMPGHNALAAAPHIRFHDLANESWIAPGEGTAGSVALERLCASHGFEAKIVFRSDNYVVIRALVRSGLGMALVPQLAHLSETGIKSSSLGRNAGCRHVLALYRHANTNPLLPDTLRALADAADDERLRCSAPVGWCEEDWDAATAAPVETSELGEPAMSVPAQRQLG